VNFAMAMTEDTKPSLSPQGAESRASKAPMKGQPSSAQQSEGGPRRRRRRNQPRRARAMVSASSSPERDPYTDDGGEG
jgi:hypothetical protein